MTATRKPNQPGDAETRALSEDQVWGLLRELHRLGKPLGIVFPSADTGGLAIDGAVVVSFGGGPVSTVTNLLHLLRQQAAPVGE